MYPCEAFNTAVVGLYGPAVAPSVVADMVTVFEDNGLNIGADLPTVEITTGVDGSLAVLKESIARFRTDGSTDAMRTVLEILRGDGLQGHTLREIARGEALHPCDPDWEAVLNAEE
jgi:hypothetical protein